jgi:hypothetical protein
MFHHVVPFNFLYRHCICENARLEFIDHRLPRYTVNKGECPNV